MPFLQDLVHRIEEAGHARYFRYIIVTLLMVFFGLVYNVRGFRNMTTLEAMDAAQIGRNIARGKGFTTQFIRPFSMHLLEQRALATLGKPEPGKLAERAGLVGDHPDIANAPAYPVVLAGLMRLLPFDYSISTTKPFWSSYGRFWRHQPDFLIAVFNELLLLVVILMAFLWARRLFDQTVAWASAVLLFTSDLLWRFSISGLSTMLLVLIFMGLVWCLTLLEEGCREPTVPGRRLYLLAVIVGALLGLGALTRYSFGWLLLPVLVFVILFTGSRRAVLGLTIVAVFAAALTPWLVRTYQLSGYPFGTATFATVADTMSKYTEFKLERSLSPEVHLAFKPLWAKLLGNSRRILQGLFASLGGGWITGFFMVGLLVGFRNPTIRRIRYFLLMSLGMLLLVQALGHTQLSEASPEINSENLMVLGLPLVLILGVSLFFLLLDQMPFAVRQLRYVVMVVFGLLVCLPFFFVMLPPRTIPVNSPYNPAAIQLVTSWMKPEELMMSDIPWAVAWYGDRQCVWLTLHAMQDPAKPNAQENFLTINDDYGRTIHALYLTPETMDSRFLSDWIRAGENSWGSFILDSLVKKEVPPMFPLKESPFGFLPEQLFLSDWRRWRHTE